MEQKVEENFRNGPASRGVTRTEPVSEGKALKKKLRLTPDGFVHCKPEMNMYF